MWARLLRDERGQGLTEYALIVVLVSVGAAGILTLLGLRARDLLGLLTFPPG